MKFRVLQRLPVQTVEFRRATDFELQPGHALGQGLGIFPLRLGAAEDLLEQGLTVAPDTGGGLPVAHLFDEGEFEVVLEIPFQVSFFLFAEGVADADRVFRAMVKAHYGIGAIGAGAFGEGDEGHGLGLYAVRYAFGIRRLWWIWHSGGVWPMRWRNQLG